MPRALNLESCSPKLLRIAELGEVDLASCCSGGSLDQGVRRGEPWRSEAVFPRSRMR